MNSSPLNEFRDLFMKEITTILHPASVSSTFLRLYIHVRSYSICLSVPGLFHLGSSVLSQMTGFPSFLWLNNIPERERERESVCVCVRAHV